MGPRKQTMRLLFSVAIALSLAFAHANPTVITRAEVPSKINATYFDIIVDIRAPWEYQAGHIKGAINLPMPNAVEALRGCENQKIAVHCFRGNDRARPFARFLASSGYSNVYDIGGFRDIRDHVETESGAWNGQLPSCASTVRPQYITAEARLTGLTPADFDQSTTIS